MSAELTEMVPDTSAWKLASWFYLPEEKLCVCVPAKNGMTSFRAAVEPQIDNTTGFRRWMWATGRGPMRPDVVAARYPDAEKLLAVRHPVDRFASLWRDKCRGTQKPSNPLGGLSPHQLISLIEQFPMGNVHWFHQHAYLVPGAILVGFDQMLPRLGYPNIARNVTKKDEPDPAMPVARIKEFYAQDYALWLSL